MTTLLRGIAVFGLGLMLFHPPEARALVGQKAPEIAGPDWINSDPRSLRDLRGRVVMVEFWTFGCSNCRNVEPRIIRWHRAYADRGLVVIGVHTPEFPYEKERNAVEKYIRKEKIPYPVVVDNDHAIWERFGNHYWPAIYLIDKRGVIRYVRIGEGGYAETEGVIRRLLAETP